MRHYSNVEYDHSFVSPFLSPFLQEYSILHQCKVDALVMRQLKIDLFKMIALKLQAVSHNASLYSTICLYH